MDLVNITFYSCNCSIIKQADISIDRAGDTFSSGIVTNVEKPTEDLGTTVNVYDREAGGFSQFTYLKYKQGSAASGVAGSLCGTVKGQDYEVTPDGADIGAGALPAIALADMDDGRYGWFWTGGKCPIGLVPVLSSLAVAEHNSIAQGAAIELYASGNSIVVSAATMASKPVAGYVKVATV